MMRLEYQKIATAGMKALGGVYVHVNGCGLPKPLIDLVYLRASQVNGCAYCVDSHSHDLLGAGVPARKLVLVPLGKRLTTSSVTVSALRLHEPKQ